MSLKAVRRYCVEFCMNGMAKEVELCPSSECALYPFRTGQSVGGGGVESRKAIKERCLDCSGTAQAARQCPFTDCRLWAIRTGRRKPRVLVDAASRVSAMRTKSFRRPPRSEGYLDTATRARSWQRTAARVPQEQGREELDE